LDSLDSVLAHMLEGEFKRQQQTLDMIATG
jgi:hypothetical protein